MTTDEPGLLTARDVMRRLGLSTSSFYRREKAGQFKFLMVTRPFGSRRYSRAKLEQFLAGESTVTFGGRKAS